MANKTVFLKNNYKLEVVNASDVLNSMKFNDEIDFYLTKEIIKHIETKAGNTIRDNKTVLIPYIGNLRKCAVRQEFKKTFKFLKTAHELMNKEDYKEYVRETYRECMSKVSDKQTSTILRNRLISNNRKKYDMLYKNLGEIYANTWIYSLLLIKPIEFNQEVEDIFNELNYESSY